jgi:FkbM family methyltransferase
MLKHFIDCGSFTGGTIGRFRTDYPVAADFLIHAFDPDPRMKWQSSGVAHHEAAVWTEDGETPFYLGDLESSSLYRDKTTGNIRREDPVMVKTVDFSRWLWETVAPDDYCVLKLNIELAEIPVLERMCDTGSIRLVDELFVEWHLGKAPWLTQERQDALIERLNDHGLTAKNFTPRRIEGYP